MRRDQMGKPAVVQCAGNGCRRLIRQMPVQTTHAAFQKFWINGLAQQPGVVVAFQQQGIAALKMRHHMRRCMAQIGQYAEFCRTIEVP